MTHTIIVDFNNTKASNKKIDAFLKANNVQVKDAFEKDYGIALELDKDVWRQANSFFSNSEFSIDEI